tara:strand:+ start:73211 stop:73627 length:417 start_codon:yes stop_codon:yes gene_type:complete
MKATFDHIFISPKDWVKTKEFYESQMGMKTVASWGDSPGHRGAVLKNDSGFSLAIAEDHGDEDPTGSEPGKADHAWREGINGVRPTLHLNVEDIHRAFESITDKSAIVIPPEITHWGTKWFIIKDPDDNLIAINQEVK